MKLPLGSGLLSAPKGREPWSVNGERFQIGTGDLDPNGRFVGRGDRAELTIDGSEVPVVVSERGKSLTA